MLFLEMSYRHSPDRPLRGSQCPTVGSDLQHPRLAPEARPLLGAIKNRASALFGFYGEAEGAIPSDYQVTLSEHASVLEALQLPSPGQYELGARADIEADLRVELEYAQAGNQTSCKVRVGLTRWHSQPTRPMSSRGAMTVCLLRDVSPASGSLPKRRPRLLRRSPVEDPL
ncbi:MAG: hypothetical protein KY476_16800 [Planctomycetes bacterium]|nr:hypothetical protein [Planctomycetota bacterium]